MRKHNYSEEEKQHARRLLLIHNGDVGIVQGLTGIPKRTLYDWRNVWNDDYHIFVDAFAQKIISYADAKNHRLSTPKPTVDNDSDTTKSADSSAQFTQLREILMNHVMTLANNLILNDAYVNNRVIALSRLIDRVIELDDMLVENVESSENVVRFEYYYNGTVHSEPPWAGASAGMPRKRKPDDRSDPQSDTDAIDPIFAYNPPESIDDWST